MLSDCKAEEEEAKRKADEEARLKAEQEARLKAEAEAKRKAEDTTICCPMPLSLLPGHS